MNRPHTEVASFLAQTRALPKLDRLLAAGLLTGASIYFQLGADWDLASGAAPLLALPVVLSALLFGMDCGFASAVGAAALNWFIFAPPHYSPFIQDWRDLMRVIAFVIIGLCAALVLNLALSRAKAAA
jgi:hypothetical protein